MILNKADGIDTDSCATLESAASSGNVEAVRMLLDAGAKIQNGVPLHFAAGACPPDTNSHVARVMPSKEFDISKISTMELLVECGADVNKKGVAAYGSAVYDFLCSDGGGCRASKVVVTVWGKSRGKRGLWECRRVREVFGKRRNENDNRRGVGSEDVESYYRRSPLIWPFAF